MRGPSMTRSRRFDSECKEEGITLLSLLCGARNYPNSEITAKTSRMRTKSPALKKADA